MNPRLLGRKVMAAFVLLRILWRRAGQRVNANSPDGPADRCATAEHHADSCCDSDAGAIGRANRLLVQPRSNEEIYLMNLDGSGLINLTNSPDGDDYSPAWAPNGRRIVFASGRDGKGDIYLMNADSRQLN